MRLVPSYAQLTLAILLGSACMPIRAPLPDAAGFSLVAFGEAGYLSHLPPEWSPTNRGDCAELGVTGQRRLQSAIPSLVEHDVEVVVLMWGTNDADGRDALVAETVRSIEQLVAAGITPVVAFPPPSLAPSPQGALVNARLEEVEWLIAMESIGRDVAFVDLYARFLDEPDPSAYFTADGVHLNADGAAFAARQIEQVVAPLYDRWRQRAHES